MTKGKMTNAELIIRSLLAVLDAQTILRNHLFPHDINENTFHLPNFFFSFSRHHVPANSVAHSLPRASLSENLSHL